MRTGPISERLNAFENALRADLEGVATVVGADLVPEALYLVDITPLAPGALKTSWLETDADLTVFAGRHGEWTLDRAEENVDFLQSVVLSTIAGRVLDVVAPAGRRRTHVTFENGETDHATRYDGCLALLLPLPGWPRWGRVTRYLPYR